MPGDKQWMVIRTLKPNFGELLQLHNASNFLETSPKKDSPLIGSKRKMRFIRKWNRDQVTTIIKWPTQCESNCVPELIFQSV